MSSVGSAPLLRHDHGSCTMTSRSHRGDTLEDGMEFLMRSGPLAFLETETHERRGGAGVDLRHVGSGFAHLDVGLQSPTNVYARRLRDAVDRNLVRPTGAVRGRLAVFASPTIALVQPWRAGPSL